MAEHEGYACRHLAECQCFATRSMFRLVGASFYTVFHEAEQVTYECAECGDVVAVFYRVPKLEQERVEVDKATIGKVIKADRRVAWVGYAKNPSTVIISDNELAREAKLLCVGTMNNAIFGFDSVISPSVGGLPTITPEHAERFLQDVNWRVRRGFEQWARYRLRGEAYRTNPLRDRGLWFQDVPVEGEVVTIVACVTGTQSSAYHGYSGSLDDYCEAYLDGAVHHSLYGIVTDEGLRRLVHPVDVEEEVSDEGSD